MGRSARNRPRGAATTQARRNLLGLRRI